MTNQQPTKWYGFVPNLFTSLNLVCGVVGTYLVLNGKIQTAIILMFVAAVFDFFDGFLDRRPLRSSLRETVIKSNGLVGASSLKCCGKCLVVLLVGAAELIKLVIELDGSFCQFDTIKLVLRNATIHRRHKFG